MKVTLVGGAGGIGSSVAFNLLLTGGFEVVLVDPRAEMVSSHVMDLEQVLEQASPGSIREGDEDDLRGADVVVVTASIAEGPSGTRLLFLEGNAAIVRRLAELLGGGWPGLVLIVTNPVDPLVTLFQRATGIDRRRVIGYTLNDTLRLRTGIAQTLGIAPGRVEAWVLGEHGDAAVPVFERVSVDGERVELSADQRAAAAEFTRGWFVRHKALDSGRSSTWTSGLGAARMVRAMANGSGGLFPASVMLEGEYGIEGVSVSVPVTLGPGGIERIHEWQLAPETLAGLGRAADAVRGALAGVD